MRKIFLFLIIAFLIINVSGVSAVDIVYDDFEDGNLNEWTLIHLGTSADWTSSTTNPYQGSYHAQSQPTYTTQPASVIERIISTSGYEDIVFKYYKRNIGLDVADEFQAEWYNGTNWTLVESTGSSSSNDAAYVSRSYSLPASATNNPNFAIKFECTAGATSEYCRIDNVNISGTIMIDTTPPYFALIPNLTNITYGQGFGVDFDAADEISFSSYSVNWTNYFSINQSGYLKNTTGLPAGTYNINVSINDSSGNTNSTIYQIVVDKATQSITPLLNGINSNLIINYSQQVNASYSGVNYTAVTIKLNSNQINIAQNYTLAVGNYFLNYSVAGNQNYSSYETYLNLTINKATPILTFLANGGTSNLTLIYPQQVNISARADYGTVNLDKDGINYLSNNGLNVSLAAGSYIFRANITGNQNYSDVGYSYYNVTINKATSTIGMYINGTAGNQTGYYGVQTNVSVSLGNSEQTITLYKNAIDDTPNLNVYQALEIGDYNFTAVAGSTQNYSLLTITRYSHILCQENLQNTSWSNWVNNGSCKIDNLQEQVRNKTQYDANSCSYVNTTFYEYQNISCDYCSYNVINSSWSEWENISCLISDLMNQSKYKIEYDENYQSCYAVTGLESDLWNSGNNNTYYEYRQIESCNYCTPDLRNTTTGDWYFTEDCQPDDTRKRQRNWTQYDINNCGEIENITYYENESVACDFLTITCEVGGPYQQGALVLFIGNVTNSTNVLIGEDVDIGLYKNNELNLSRILQTSEDGDFETGFSNLSAGEYKINASVSYLGVNRTCSKTFEIGSAALLVLDKTASLHNLSNNEIFYNVSLRILNTGGSECINLNLSDVDYGSYELGKISPGEIIKISYLMNFTRQNSTDYYLLQSAGVEGIDSYSGFLISVNSSYLNLTIPSSSYSPGKQIVIIKNIIYSQETRLNVTYNVSVLIYNTGDEDLENINYIDSDFNSGILLNLSRGEFKEFSNLIIIDKAASNIQHEFALGSITIGSDVFYSNRPKINIPGYGGPADLYVYAPASVTSSTSLDSLIEVLNINPDIGQDFVIDYWVTSNDENINYSSGQKTVYVSALGRTNVSVNLIAPAGEGNYKLKAIVSWAGGSATAFDSFEVVSGQIIIPPASGGGGGREDGGGEGDEIIINETNKTKIINETKEKEAESEKINGSGEGIICNPPYIRYGKECCLDENNNNVCDEDETKRGITGLFLREDGTIYINYSLLWLLLLLLLIIFIIYKLIRRLPKLFAKPKKNKNIMRLKDLIKLSVYTNEGIKIGKVIDIFLKENKIESLKIKLIKKKSKKIRKKGILLNYKYVENIGEIVIIDKRVIDIFDNINL